MMKLMTGVKTDSIEYRYSYDWLFRLMAEENVHYVQLGSFFELYQLPDEYFRDLRRRAEDCGVVISSCFTAHRELGGFFRDDGPGWADVAHRNYARMIEVGGLLGATRVGSNPGAVLRDRTGTKPEGVRNYIRHMQQLMHVAADNGVQWLTIEPMSCLAEPPTLPEEMRDIASELDAYHAANPGSTSRVGYCADVSHGYVDSAGDIRHDHMALVEAALPWVCELHLKNTDRKFLSTFGFAPAENEKGVVDVRQVRDLLVARAGTLPVSELTGFLEIGGPKLGRDSTDGALEGMLRESLRYIKANFECTTETVAEAEQQSVASAIEIRSPDVRIAPSLMCADLCHLEAEIRKLEGAGSDWLHLDIMDAHFVPNMPLGLATIEQLRPLTSLPFDAHLMVENPDFFVRALGRIGVQSISVQVESCLHLDRTLQLIRELGIKAGAALNPATPLTALDYVMDHLDYVLIMTVNPGFAGQKIVPSAFRKIADCRARFESQGRQVLIEVDGNVSFENIPRMVAAGADVLVAGTSSIFSRGNPIGRNAMRMRAGIAEGIALRDSAARKVAG